MNGPLTTTNEYAEQNEGIKVIRAGRQQEGIHQTTTAFQQPMLRPLAKVTTRINHVASMVFPAPSLTP